MSRIVRYLKQLQVPSTQALCIHSNRTFPRGWELKGNLADRYALLPLTLLILLHSKPSYINTTVIRLNMCLT
jgi:hypothetical protein